MANTLQDYLISLGFKVDTPSYKKYLSSIENTTKGLAGVGEAAIGMAAAVFLSVDMTARHYERLYYVSQRTQRSVQFLQQYRFAAQQIGLTAEEAQSSVESFTAAMRTNPGLAALAGGAQTPAQLVGRLKGQFGEAGYFVAQRFGQMFGLDETTFRMLWMNLDRLQKEENQFRRRQREFGIDAESSAKKFTDFSRSVNTLNSNFAMLNTRLALDFLDPASRGVHLLTNFTEWLGKVDKETNGWALTLGTVLATALTASLFKLNNLKALLMTVRGVLPLAVVGGMIAMKQDKDHSLRSWLRGILGIEETEEEKNAPAPWERKPKSMTFAFPPIPGRGTPVPSSPRVWGDKEAEDAGLYEPSVPLPRARPLGAGSGRQSSIIHLNPMTNIHVHGGGESVANRVADLQSRVWGDVVRNLKGTA